MPRVRAVVLNHNGGDHVLRCLDHLHATEWPEADLDLVVIDNDSHDGSDRELEVRFPRVRLIRTGANVGFPANNLAMTDLDDIEYVALVNNDAFVEPDWLAPLVAELAGDPSLGAVCPKILFEPGFVDVVVASPTFRPGGADPRGLGVRVSGVELDGRDCWSSAHFAGGFWGLEHGHRDEHLFQWTNGSAVLRAPVDPAKPARGTLRVRMAGPSGTTVQLACGGRVVEVGVGDTPSWAEVRLTGEPYDVVNNVGSVLVVGGSGADRGFLERDEGQYDDPADVFNWCGAGVLFSVDYLRDVGLLDERFFMYYEDTDMSWRARALGWRHRYVPTSVFRHLHAATSGEGSAFFTHHVERNRLLLLLKNAPLRLLVGAVVRYVLVTASYARRDIVLPVLRRRRPSPTLTLRRARAFGGFVRLIPHGLSARRRLRRRQVVSDEELLSWMVPQP